MPTPQAITSTSQQYLDIFDITNNLVILKDGSVSLILTVTAMNFGLLAEEEQDAIIYGYAGLLNSLNYPIQILIRSQTKDVTSYLNILKAKEDETVNRNKKEQIKRYREFVADLVQERNVLDKKFYVIIPATALELGLVSTQSVLPGVKTPDISTYDRSVIIERAKNTLEPKRDHIMAQFGRIGLLSRQLKTQEIIQLFYSIYNPEASDGQRITDSNNYTTSLVNGNMSEEVFGKTRSEAPENLTVHTSPQVMPQVENTTQGGLEAQPQQQPPAPLPPEPELMAPTASLPQNTALQETSSIISRVEPAPVMPATPAVTSAPVTTAPPSMPITPIFEPDKTPPPSKVNVVPVPALHVSASESTAQPVAHTEPTQSEIDAILKGSGTGSLGGISAPPLSSNEDTLPPPVEIV
jgi:hypothetical protein